MTDRDGPVLSVSDLRVRFSTGRGDAHVVNGLSYEVHPAETVGLVGESGSGKSVSAMSLLGLVPQPPGRIEGEVRFDDRDLLGISDEDMRAIRGNRISMIFQDPMTSLNPVLTIGRQLTEGVQLHLGLSPEDARDRAVELLDRVRLPEPRARLDEYPHQLSGGMRQRVMIAMALACDPEVIIADEATTALDVTTQAQVIELIGRLQEDLGTAVIWITHDLGVVAGIADRVLVMYAGQIVESATVTELYDNPSHPYTLALLGSLPLLGEDRPDRLRTVSGLPPDPLDLPVGCSFWPRCPQRLDNRCESEPPPLREVATGHVVRCFYDVPDDAKRRSSP